MGNEFPLRLEHKDLRPAMERTLKELRHFFGVENLSMIELVELRNILKDVKQQIDRENEQYGQELSKNKKIMSNEVLWKWKVEQSNNRIPNAEFEAAARWVCQLLGMVLCSKIYSIRKAS